MSTAKKTFNAAIGAGTVVLEKAREIPQRVVDLPSTLTARVPDLRELPKSVNLRELPKTVQDFGSTQAERASKVLDDARGRATRLYTELSKRGESVVKKVKRSASSKRAVAQTKSAKSKVKAAATSVKSAATADVEAVKSAVETAAETTAEQAS